MLRGRLSMSQVNALFNDSPKGTKTRNAKETAVSNFMISHTGTFHSYSHAIARNILLDTDEVKKYYLV